MSAQLFSRTGVHLLLLRSVERHLAKINFVIITVCGCV
jgi:hypothetical protein